MLVDPAPGELHQEPSSLVTQNTCTTKPQSTNHATQCNSCLYLYHNKLVGFVLHDKEHTMPITLVPELCCLIIGSGREDNSKFRLLDLISFLKISDYDFFQANFFSQLYFYEKETDGCWLSISAVFHSDRTSQSSTRSPPQNHINNNHIITL